eukprot:GHUV01030496.1.p1 GENE.GHUV01030496.1~~GHUV01030496.1.p1  ORF type:complete len:145 (-),score=18.22 GHUV01030496.1:44-478(-)
MRKPSLFACYRSRDSAVLSDCDVIIDVGGVYEPNNNRFDHHQRGFEEVFGFGFNTKLSSAGALAVVGCYTVWPPCPTSLLCFQSYQSAVAPVSSTYAVPVISRLRSTSPQGSRTSSASRQQGGHLANTRCTVSPFLVCICRSCI